MAGEIGGQGGGLGELAHKQLDAAVFAAYGLPEGLSDDDILQQPPDLTLERSGKQFQ